MDLRRIALICCAIICISAAFILIFQIGLPMRAEFTGVLADNGQQIAPEINAYAPVFELQTLDSATLNLANLRGYPVLVNFWATWCEPCKVEMPALQSIYETYKGRGLKIIAVNIGETPRIVHQWTQQMNLTFDVVIDPYARTAAVYQLRGQPSTYVVSPDGIIAQIFFGPTTEAALEIALAPYFSNGYTIDK